MTKAHTKQRNIEFIGDHKNNSIVIGNYGDAKFTAKGNFDLSGMIYCLKNTIEFNLTGDGVVSFSGKCKILMIRGIDGNITLDLNNLSSDVVWCESVKGKSTVILGPTKVIELISLDNDAVVRYDGKTVVMNYSVRGNSKIEVWKTAV